MTVDERRRSDLYRAVSEVLGEEPAATMFELLPPPATEVSSRQDLHGVETRLGARIDLVEQRLTSLENRLVDHQRTSDERFETQQHAWDERFDTLQRTWDQRLTAQQHAWDQRLDAHERAWDERFEAQRHELDARLDGLRDELLAAFRGELVTAVSGQTRAVIVACALALFGAGGMAISVAVLL